MSKKAELLRVQADINQGLTSEEVKQRVQLKKTNKVKKVVGKSYLSIFVGNLCTFFNLLGFIVFIISLIAHSGLANMTFIVIIVANTAIGIFQEIRSKNCGGKTVAGVRTDCACSPRRRRTNY